MARARLPERLLRPLADDPARRAGGRDAARGARARPRLEAPLRVGRGPGAGAVLPRRQALARGAGRGAAELLPAGAVEAGVRSSARTLCACTRSSGAPRPPPRRRDRVRGHALLRRAHAAPAALRRALRSHQDGRGTARGRVSPRRPGRRHPQRIPRGPLRSQADRDHGALPDRGQLDRVRLRRFDRSPRHGSLHAGPRKRLRVDGGAHVARVGSTGRSPRAADRERARRGHRRRDVRAGGGSACVRRRHGPRVRGHRRDLPGRRRRRAQDAGAAAAARVSRSGGSGARSRTRGSWAGSGSSRCPRSCSACRECSCR